MRFIRQKEGDEGACNKWSTDGQRLLRWAMSCKSIHGLKVQGNLKSSRVLAAPMDN